MLGLPHWDNPSNRLSGNIAGVNLMRVISFLHWYEEVITLLKSVLKWALGKADI